MTPAPNGGCRDVALLFFRLKIVAGTGVLRHVLSYPVDMSILHFRQAFRVAGALASLATLVACSSTNADVEPAPLPTSDPTRAEAGTTTPPAEGGTEAGAPADGSAPPAPISPITCDASGCTGMVGSIKIFGFSSKAEAERVATVLLALPPSLTRSANFDVTRDTVSQVGCPDPTRVSVTTVPAQCGYAGVDTVGTRLLLKLRDATMTVLPLRLDHVLTDFAARDWFLAHQDEVVSMRYGRLPTWTPGCYACPADAQEPCLSQDSSVPYVQVLRELTSSVAATLLKAKAWGGVGPAWKGTNNAACSAAGRQTWIEDRLVAEKPASIVSQGLDIVKLCGAGKSVVNYSIRTTAGTANVTLATIGGATGGTILSSINAGTATTTATSKQFTMTGGMVRMIGRADQPFLLDFVSCQ